MNLSGSPRVDGGDDGDEIDDLENEFNYAQGNNKARRQWEDVDLSSSSRHETLIHPLFLLCKKWRQMQDWCLDLIKGMNLFELGTILMVGYVFFRYPF